MFRMAMLLATMGLLLQIFQAEANAPISACTNLQPMSAGSMPGEECQSYMVGAAHGFNHAMKSYGYPRLFCLTAEATDPATLVNRTLVAFRRTAQDKPEMALLTGILSALMDSFPCSDQTTGAAFSGFVLGQVLVWCQNGLANDTEAAGCSSFIFGASSALTITSGQQGAEKWSCTPNTGVSSKLVIGMMVDDAIEDPSRQQLPAMQVMAENLIKQYPCD